LWLVITFSGCLLLTQPGAGESEEFKNAPLLKVRHHQEELRSTLFLASGFSPLPGELRSTHSPRNEYPTIVETLEGIYGIPLLSWSRHMTKRVEHRQRDYTGARSEQAQKKQGFSVAFITQQMSTC